MKDVAKITIHERFKCCGGKCGGKEKKKENIKAGG